MSIPFQQGTASSIDLVTELALLGFLTSGPRHGYAIYREFSGASSVWLVWRIKQSQLYALLARLEENGYLTSFKQEAVNGRPPRKMYQITPTGHDAYQVWLQAPVERGRQFRLDLLVKLFFAQRAGQTAVTHLLAAQRAACESWLKETITQENTETEPFAQLVHNYRTGQIQAMLSWLDKCQEMLMQPPSTV